MSLRFTRSGYWARAISRRFRAFPQSSGWASPPATGGVICSSPDISSSSRASSGFAALGAAALGVWPRVACLCAGLLLYHLAPLETIFWTPNPYERGFTISVLALLTLSFSRCGDALCLSLRRTAPVSPSGEYQWPVRLVQLLLCQVYFIAGYAKLVRAGLSWAGAANIRGWLLVFSQQDQVAVIDQLARWIADQPWLCLLIGVSTLTLDFGLITMVLWPRLRLWLIPITMLFHAGILLTMGILFLNVPQFLVFVDWGAVRRNWTRSASAPHDRARTEPGQIRSKTSADIRATKSPEDPVKVEVDEGQRQ